MSNKLIPYDIVYCSSEDEAHRIDQLVGHSYHSIALEEGTPGWQCAKGVDYPQVLILRFPGNAWLQQLRLLSHEVKIASKVEVRLYQLKKEELSSPPSFTDVRFSKLGYVQFSNNEESRYESKERKTINLKAEAYFMKLLFYEPYNNPMNRAEQVGIYAIECVGSMRQRVHMHIDMQLSTYGNADLLQEEEDSRAYSTAEPSLNVTPFHSSPRRRPTYLDVESKVLQPVLPVKCAFRSVPITQFDTFFVQRAEELIAMREVARGAGDHTMVDACTEKMNTLNAISMEMYTLEQEKVAAIVDENFGEAKRIKEAMEEMLAVVIRETELSESAASHPTRPDPMHQTPASRTGLRIPQEKLEVDMSDILPPTAPQQHIKLNESLTSFNGRRHSTSSERNVNHPPEDSSTLNDREVNAAVADSMAVEDIADPDERLVADFIFSVAGEDERYFVVAPDVVFETRRMVSTVGSFVTACLLSKRFKLREAALVAITERMSDAYASNAALVEDAILRFLDYSNYGLQDNFPNVVLASCIYIRLCVGDEFQCIENVITPLSLLVPRLLTRAADPTPRIREEALGTLEQMAMHPSLPSQVFLHAVLAEPVDKDRAKVPSIKPRPQLARLFLLQILLQEKRLGTTPHKNLYPTVLLPCLNHANSEVRDVGAGITQTLIREGIVALRKTDVIKIHNPALRDAVKNAVREMEPPIEEKAKKKKK